MGGKSISRLTFLAAMATTQLAFGGAASDAAPPAHEGH